MSEHGTFSIRVVDDNGNGGTFKLPLGTIVKSQSFLTIARNRKGFRQMYGYDPDVSGMSLSLNNNGDCLLLMDGTTIIDAVAWEGGSSKGAPADWGSSSLPSAQEKTSIHRANLTIDGDSHEDWLSNQKPSPGK